MPLQRVILEAWVTGVNAKGNPATGTSEAVSSLRAQWSPSQVREEQVQGGASLDFALAIASKSNPWGEDVVYPGGGTGSTDGGMVRQ